MALNERMSFWDTKLEQSDDPPPQEQTLFADFGDSDMDHSTLDVTEDENDMDDPEIQPSPHLHAYKDFIFNSSAYQWLLAILSTELALAPAEPNIMEDLRHEIMSALPSPHRVSRRKPSNAYMMTFTVNWDPLAFISQQGYGEMPDDAVERAITLTGSAKNAQALTCAQYVRQTWPLTGEHTFRLVKDCIRSSDNRHHTLDLPDSTSLTGWLHGSKLIGQVLGTGPSVAEVGQQLAWFGAALRSSPNERGVTYCMPFINNIWANSVPCRGSTGLSWHEASCEIDFTIEASEDDDGPTNGQCWHLLFNNPVLVKGYPIPHRPERDTGLEIPLNMMTCLTEAQRVTFFNQMLFIKGFSSMLVPTKGSADLIVWHLLYNTDGSRISYLDSTVPRANFLALSTWKTLVIFSAGAAEANYKTRTSKLPKWHETSIFQDISISGGQIVTGDPIAIGAKDTRIERGGYISKLKWLYQKFVVLWDEEQKRGWLANGASALLHLLRASLAHDGTSKFKSVFLFKPHEMAESSDPYKADSAIDILLSATNRELKLYPENNGFIRLEHRINHLYGMLEQMIDYQHLMNIKRKQHSNHPRSLSRRYLEGWKFDDVAKDRDTFYPRAAKLQESPTWKDLIKDINAVILFGRAFGDLIQPTGDVSCQYWAKMPEQKHYLGACISDLRNVMDNYGGDEEADPIQLTDNISWHSPSGLFGGCQCTENSEDRHCDLVQVLLSTRHSGRILESAPAPLEDCGAVIFGQSEHFERPQSESEDSQEVVTSSITSDSDSEFHDSGVGSSSATPSNSRLVAAPTPAQYKVGIVCALQKELLAIRALFDEKCDDLKPPPHDTNHYSFGRMGSMEQTQLPLLLYISGAASPQWNSVSSLALEGVCLLRKTTFDSVMWWLACRRIPIQASFK